MAVDIGKRDMMSCLEEEAWIFRYATLLGTFKEM
jgi:hypothetical protein